MQVHRAALSGLPWLFVTVTQTHPQRQTELLAADWVAASHASDSDAGLLAHIGFRPATPNNNRMASASVAPTIPFSPGTYLQDPQRWRALSVVPAGSAHAQRVWHALNKIPVGETRSYGELAKALNSSPRAVGQACRANPWPLFIPCHRVTPAGWSLGAHRAGGYSGDRLGPLAELKSWLLHHERNCNSSPLPQIGGTNLFSC